MYYILSNPRLIKSAKFLAARLGELYGDQIFVRTVPDEKSNCIIRYGISRYIVGGTKFNDPELISLAGNKLRLSHFLKEKEFPHVELHTKVIPDEFPIVIREELNRGGGIGIKIIEDGRQFEGQPFSYWCDFSFELGVHILGGEIVKVFKKVREDGLEEEKYPIKNTHRGYRFKVRPEWKKLYRGLEKYVKELHKIFPIQFARLDIGYDEEYKLIEINSAPDLTQNVNTLNLYADFLFNRVLKENKER